MTEHVNVEVLRGAPVVDSRGVRIGAVGDVYLDDASGEAAWATIKSGLFRRRTWFVPLVGASFDGSLRLPFTKDAVVAAPDVLEDEHLSSEEEAVLYAHFGLDPAMLAREDDSEPGPLTDLDAPLRRAEQAVAEAVSTAHRADPLRDGSYAGDAAKAPLVDTPDLEAHDHRLAAQGHAPQVQWAGVRYEASKPAASGGWQASESKPVELTGEDLAQQRAAELDVMTREAAWDIAHGRRPDLDLEDDL